MPEAQNLPEAVAEVPEAPGPRGPWIHEKHYEVSVAYGGHLDHNQPETTKHEGLTKDQLLLESRGNDEGGKGKAKDNRETLIFKILVGQWM